ncbi:aminoacyl-histidine dipeptidase [candidate division KSB1 bacterium]|nr:aminoacyl-histidine dipeptidase [candidate division KSB1 bacterium]RQW02175.1 MAG: aminoacyl-histidine dipeptidase [candidate division KSB1 bacterium]
MSVIDNVEPKLLWKHFDALRQIPRPSGDEGAAAEYVISVAKKLGCHYEKDTTGNVIIRTAGSPGHENAKKIVLQSHLDMVCEKDSDKEFDFSSDAIQLMRDGDWLKADGTTLGADNGIGVAATLAIFEDDSLVHGPLEGLFTVDEERGLNGAMSVASDWLTGRTMINLDSEEIGVFSIGCAGGRDTNFTLPVTRVAATGDRSLKIRLYGLRGGHSGIDIHEYRGNALKILNRLLYQVQQTIPIEIACFLGGDKHNAIPREAFAQIVIDSARRDELKAWFDKAIGDVQTEFNPIEQNIAITIEDIDKTEHQVLAAESQGKLLALIFALPHGPLAMSRTIENLVETSNNVAAVKCEQDAIKILTSSRSSNMKALQATLDKLVSIAGLAGATVEQPNGYPGWMPNLDSEVLKVALDAYKKVTNKEAKYEAIHAGLECGLIGEKFPGMDMISVGPTLKHPHSPDERVHMGTVEVFYKHVIKMLELLA